MKTDKWEIWSDNWYQICLGLCGMDTITTLLKSSGMWQPIVWEIETLPDYKV